MKNVMTRAWEIAEEAVVKFGGSAVEYLSGALKMAWAEAKNNGDKPAVELESKEAAHKNEWVDGKLVLNASKRQPAWVAKINGTHERFEFDREFLSESDYDEDQGSYFSVELCEGAVWNWKESRTQCYGIVEDGQLYTISKKDVYKLIKR